MGGPSSSSPAPELLAAPSESHYQTWWTWPQSHSNLCMFVNGLYIHFSFKTMISWGWEYVTNIRTSPAPRSSWGLYHPRPAPQAWACLPGPCAHLRALTPFASTVCHEPWCDLIRNLLGTCRASLVAQMVKNLPAMWETRVQFLGWEDSLKKEMATHSSTHAWRILWTKEPGGLQSVGSQRVRHNWWLIHTRSPQVFQVSLRLCLLAPQTWILTDVLAASFCTYVDSGVSAGKESACNAGHLGLIPGVGRFPWRILTWRIPWTV